MRNNSKGGKETKLKNRIDRFLLVARRTLSLSLSVSLPKEERNGEGGREGASEAVSSPRTTFGCAKTFRGVVELIGDTAAVIAKYGWRERLVVVVGEAGKRYSFFPDQRIRQGVVTRLSSASLAARRRPILFLHRCCCCCCCSSSSSSFSSSSVVVVVRP